MRLLYQPKVPWTWSIGKVDICRLWSTTVRSPPRIQLGLSATDSMLGTPPINMEHTSRSQKHFGSPPSRGTTQISIYFYDLCACITKLVLRLGMERSVVSSGCSGFLHQSVNLTYHHHHHHPHHHHHHHHHSLDMTLVVTEALGSIKPSQTEPNQTKTGCRLYWPGGCCRIGPPRGEPNVQSSGAERGRQRVPRMDARPSSSPAHWWPSPEPAHRMYSVIAHTQQKTISKVMWWQRDCQLKLGTIRCCLVNI